MRRRRNCHLGARPRDVTIASQSGPTYQRWEQEWTTMKYMLLMYANEANNAQFSPDEIKRITQDWAAFMKEGQETGALLLNNGLAPTANSTTVRLRDGKTLTTDGPFAETHEQLGGFALVECKDLDEAVRWALKVPHAAYGSVEIRPLWDNS
jgi:hypothetical protein